MQKIHLSSTFFIPVSTKTLLKKIKVDGTNGTFTSTNGKLSSVSGAREPANFISLCRKRLKAHLTPIAPNSPHCG